MFRPRADMMFFCNDKSLDQYFCPLEMSSLVLQYWGHFNDGLKSGRKACRTRLNGKAFVLPSFYVRLIAWKSNYIPSCLSFVVINFQTTWA